MNTIFSRYRAGENRVTSSILAVLRLLSIPAFDYLIRGLTDNDSESLINIVDQPSRGGVGVPDGEIFGNFRIVIETKVDETPKLSTANRKQLQNHLDRISGTKGGILLFLTPDAEVPEGVREIDQGRLVWKSFAHLEELISAILDDHDIRLSSDETFMLSHLRSMIKQEGLLPTRKNVLIVPANNLAWAAYQKFSVYKCQSQRTFQTTSYLGFYADGVVKKYIAKIKSRNDEVSLLDKKEWPNCDLGLRQRVEELIKHEGRDETTFQIFDLSAPSDEETIVLEADIPNDCVSKTTGRRVAFVQKQAYTSVEQLQQPNQTTSGLK